MTSATLRRLATLLAAGWLGVGIGVGLVAAPVVFATLGRAAAGAVAVRLFATDAAVSAVLGGLFLIAGRVEAHRAARQGGSFVNAKSLLPFGILFCTLAGEYAVRPLVAAVVGTPTAASFALLHGIASAFFVGKLALVAALAWRWSRPPSSPPLSS